jgi:hypothetical protein
MTAFKTNRMPCVDFASKAIANPADAIECDMIEAETEDDLQAILSHLEILERNTRTMRDMLRATLEGRTL